MRSRDDLDNLFQKINQDFKEYEQNEFGKYFITKQEMGKKTVYQKNKSEKKVFDDEWIKTIESYFPSIDRITRNPRSFIKYEEDLVNVERVKKITSRSVRHLASHTHFIKEVDENNNVIPNKVLIENAEQDFEVYENRFVFTLIKRLHIFVKRRYDLIKKNVESYQKDHVNFESELKVQDTLVKVSIDMEVKKDLDDKSINSHNYDLLERVEKLDYLITGLLGSQFMILLKDAKQVRPPIMKTNVILKNPDFKNAYNLWLFLDKYNILGYDVLVNERNLPFDDHFIEYVNDLTMLTYTTIISNQTRRKERYNAIPFKEYVKKKTRQITSNPKDFVTSPDLVQIEDNSLNEYYLNKYQAFFKKSISEYKAPKVTDYEALKKSLRDTISISNGLYEGMFDFEQEDDVFKQLVKMSVNEEYDLKKDKVRYAQAIREVKEADFYKSLRLERRLLNDLDELAEKKQKAEVDEQAKEIKKNALDKSKKELDRLLKEQEGYKKKIANVEDVKTQTQAERNSLKSAKLASQKRLEKDIQKYKEKNFAEINKEKAEIALRIEEEKRELDRLDEELKRQRELRKDEFKKLIEQEKEKVRLAFEKEKAELERKKEAEIARLKQIEKDKIAELRRKRQQENDEQKERERAAILKVKIYEERVRLEAENKAVA